MYNANVLAHVILSHARRTRTLSADDRACVASLLPRLSGMVFVLATLALKYYSIEVA